MLGLAHVDAWNGTGAMKSFNSTLADEPKERALTMIEAGRLAGLLTEPGGKERVGEIDRRLADLAGCDGRVAVEQVGEGVRFNSTCLGRGSLP